MIIGLTGRNGSGKGTVAEFLVQKGFVYHSLSDVIRDAIRQLGQDVTRERMIAKGRKLREQGGSGALADIILKGLDPKFNHIVDSVRNPGEVDVLKQRDDFFLIDVEADRKTRFERCCGRARAGDPLTLDEFIRLEEAELHSTEASAQKLVATAKRADATLKNDGTVQELEQKLNALLANLSKGVL